MKREASSTAFRISGVEEWSRIKHASLRLTSFALALFNMMSPRRSTAACLLTSSATCCESMVSAYGSAEAGADTTITCAQGVCVHVLKCHRERS